MIALNITPNWSGIMRWSLLLLRVLLTLLKTLYKQNVFGDGSGFLLALLIDSRSSEFLADSLLISSLVRRWFPSYILHPEVLDTFYILKWYGWPILGLPCRVMPWGYSYPVIPLKPGCWIVRVAWIPPVILNGQCPQSLGFVPANWWFWLVERGMDD